MSLLTGCGKERERALASLRKGNGKMTACLKNPVMETATGDAPRIGQRAQCWVAWPNACVAAALASVLFVGISGEAVAQTPGDVWAGCILEDTTVAALKAEMPVGNGNKPLFYEDGMIAFVVVYTMKDNDGQEFSANGGGGTGEFTGPVVCVNPNADVTSSPDPPAEFAGVGIAPIEQDDPIPNGQANATEVITRDAEEVFLLRYELADGDEPGTIEKILCHAVNDEMFCYRISPLLTEAP